MAGHEGFKSDLNDLTARVLEELLGFFSEVADKTLDGESQFILSRFYYALITVYDHESDINVTKICSRLQSTLRI